MRWTVHGERPLYASQWVNLTLVDVEIPGGERFEHHVVRMPAPAAATIVHDPERGVLLLWRHRFISDTWGWELPAGRVDDGETPIAAAARETFEETGWRPGPLRPLFHYQPAHGVLDQWVHVFVAEGAEHVGEPLDATESERRGWLPLDRVRAAITAGEIPDGFTLTALLYAFVTNAFSDR